MTGWIVAAVLYVLGIGITAATPTASKERGAVLRIVLLCWPLAALLGLLSLPGALLWRHEITRGSR